MKYRKKPVEIEAMQLTDSDSFSKILEWCKDSERSFEVGNCSKEHPEGFDYPCIRIKTLEGVMMASRNDYIIKGVKGEFYPCKPDIFKMTYDKV